MNEVMTAVRKHPQASLWPREVVTLAAFKVLVHTLDAELAHPSLKSWSTMDRVGHPATKSFALVIFPSSGVAGLFATTDTAGGQRSAIGDQQRDDAKDHDDDPQTLGDTWMKREAQEHHLFALRCPKNQ